MAKIFLKKSDGTFIKDSSGNFIFIWELPNEYQKVEYIESTGTQYINSDVAATASSGMEILYSQLASSSAGIFGCRSTACTFWLSQQLTGNLYAVEFTNQSRITTSAAYNTGYHKIILKNNTIEDNNISYGSYLNGANGSLKIWLFRTNENGAPYIGSCSGRLKYCKLWNNNTLVRNYIPCYRKSDNEIGLYDLVGKQFYTNAGTGTFIKGPNI